MGANRSTLVGYWLDPSPTPHVLLAAKPGLEKFSFQFSATRLELDENAIEHGLGYIGWLWSDAIKNRTAFAKAPNEGTQIEHNMCGRRAARSSLWWWPYNVWHCSVSPSSTNWRVFLFETCLHLSYFFCRSIFFVKRLETSDKTRISELKRK